MTIRELLFYGFLGCSLMLGTGALQAQGGDPIDDPAYADSVVFRNAFHHFAVAFPDNWEIEQGFSDQGLDFVVVALSPSEGSEDGFLENMNILVEELNNGVDVNQYFKWNLAGLQQELPEFKMKDNAMLTINDIPMARIAYTWKIDESETVTYQYIFVRDQKGFVLTFSTEPEKFDKYRPIFDKIAESFFFDEAPVEEAPVEEAPIEEVPVEAVAAEKAEEMMMAPTPDMDMDMEAQ